MPWGSHDRANETHDRANETQAQKPQKPQKASKAPKVPNFKESRLKVSWNSMRK